MAEPEDGISDPHRDVTGALHDVSNALTVLLGWIAEARNPDATGEAVAYALRVVEQRARIARDLARRAIGVDPVLADPDDYLASVVSEAIDGLAVEAQRAGVRLSWANGKVGVRVRASGDVLQIVTNLLMNALAHAPPGSVVEITTRTEGSCVRIEVQDQGPGVPESRRDSIFEGDSRRRGGAGIGLRHARALAHAVRGDLELLDSDAGAHFVLTWPLAELMPPPPMSVPRGRVLEGRRVLLVEDDSDVTHLLEAALTARGASVTVARSAQELPDAIASGPHDAALIDLSPIAEDISGAMEALRAQSPDAHLVFISGSAEGLPAAVSGTGGVRWVRKPFEVREIVDALVEREGLP